MASDEVIFRVPTIFWWEIQGLIKDPAVSFSRTNFRWKFTAWTVLQQYL